MAAIEVQKIMEAVEVMQADLSAFNELEAVAMAKREETRISDEASAAAKATALKSIATVQTLLAEVQARAEKSPMEIDTVLNQ